MPVGVSYLFAHALASEQEPSLTWTAASWLATVSLIAGAINSVAGGGTFLTFPVLIFLGVPPVRANATSTVGVWVGTLASMGAYRQQMLTEKWALLSLVPTSILGGFLGADLLLKTPDSTFKLILPWLLLAATLIYSFGQNISRWLHHTAHFNLRNPQHFFPWLMGCLIQLFIASYGGFFGAGIGFLMLALLTLLGYENIHTMNGLKTLLASIINAIAILTFIWAGLVAWPYALAMMAGSLLGGYYGAILAQKISAHVVRRVVIAIAALMTSYFFFITYS